MVRAEAIDAVGPLDEGFPLYVEDIDWARRMQDAGWSVYHVPGARMIHHHLAVSDRRFFGRHTWLHFRGMLRYARKHFGPRIPAWSIASERTEGWDSVRG